MILQALAELADKEGLIEDPDFEWKHVAWEVVIDPDGRLAQIASRRKNLNDGTKKKPKWMGKPMLVPRQPGRTSGDAAFFLVDKSDYALGFDPLAKWPKEKVAARVSLFADAAQQCADATGDEGAVAISRFLALHSQHADRIAQEFAREPWESNELFAFRLGLDDQPIHLRPAVREYWKRLRAPVDDAAKSGDFRCLVTGENMADVGLFPLLKKVPGGTSSGVALVSFNANAFESYGLKSNENAPISRAAAEKTSTALNRLLHDEFPDPKDPDIALPRRNIKISSDTVGSFWAKSRDQEVQGWLNILPDLLNGTKEDDVAEVYRSVWRGKRPDLKTDSDFYVLILSGAQGRAIVRDWIESTLGDALRYLQLHFDDLNIVRQAQPAKGNPPEPVIPLKRLAEALAPEGKSDNVPASLEAGFLRAAFTGLPYPFQVLQRALIRSRVEAGRNEWIDSARRDARAAMIKGVLNRRRRFDEKAQQRYPEVPMAMNPLLDNQAYTLGLLMAVLERLQQAALGDVNASLVDRYFGAASASPRSVFTRLLKNSQHHARKAADSDDGASRAMAFRLKRIIDDILSRFEISLRQYPLRAQGIPAHLDLEQQGLFVLGYHQMRHWLWMPQDQRRQWEQEHADAPAAFQWSKPELAAATE